jgi:thiol:disulfide interchange protein DsbD
VGSLAGRLASAAGGALFSASLIAQIAWLAPASVGQGVQGLSFNPVHVTVRGPTEPVPAGGRFDVVLDVRVAAPYHIYAHDSPGVSGLPTKITGEASDGLRFEATVQPVDAAHAYHDKILEEDFLLLNGAFAFRGVFAVDAGREPGPAEASLSILYMACDERGCLLPQEETYTVPLEVRAAEAGELLGGPAPAATLELPPRAAGGSLESRLSGALSSGNVGLLLWLSLVFGFVSLLTPCVFPMIPITVSFFSKRSEQAGGRGARFALAYGFGIVATYTGFGMAMAAVLGASSLQAFATNPWANLALGALFVFFGLSLMGFYDLKPPAFLARRAEGGAAAARPGYAPVFVMGFVFTIAAFTCTAPIVGSLLAALATGGSPWLIAAGMLVYSTAFALPFVLLALFPSAISALPGAGGWMITLKVVLGFLELIAALKFFSNADLVWNLQLIPRPVMLTATLLMVAALALYLLGTYRLPHDMPARLRLVSLRTLGAIAVVLACLYMACGLTGKELDPWTEAYLPPHGYGAPDGAGAPHDPIAWLHDYDEGLAEGRRTGRPIFLDFTGITCVNCRKVEKQFFGQAPFVEAAKKVVMVRLYTDRRDAEHKAGDLANQELMASFGSVTLPLYVLLSPEGEVLGLMGYSPDFTVEDFVEFLEGIER